MISIINELPELKAVSKSGKWLSIKKPYKYSINKYSYIEVPADFETDFATIPPFLLWWIGRLGKHACAALVHDFLYRERIIISHGKKTFISKNFADKIFLDMMIKFDVSKSKRTAMYLAVRVFGFLAWKKSKKK